MDKTSAIDAIRLREDVREIEWEARVEFAAAFQIFYGNGWNGSTANHMTALIPDEPAK